MVNNSTDAASKKETYGSFKSIEKERFTQRLEQLLKGRSKYQAAKDWGINLSTFKNYFSRQGSIPRYEVLEKISMHENVSIEWLLGRELEVLPKESSHEEVFERRVPSSAYDAKPSRQVLHEPTANYETGLASIFNILSEEEKKSLFELIARKGVDTVLQLKDERNLKLIQCPDYEKDRLLVLLESGAKKGSPESGENVALAGPLSDSKKAG
ncbi:TPA: hypothetical protein ACG1UU_004397 [Kluyvera ascorbata]